ncbi:transmembrane protein 203 [Palaemon carinicauda]|uniref:transmembrane protein 203 n=1 Tax=Palaemon carinicauda TaxID=392227 RepID=UPI0035B62A23
MFFKLWELTLWLGVTILEVFIWLTAILITLILVVLRVENVLPSLSWWLVLSPMFVADALNTYFCVIVLIRMYLEGVLKPAALRALWSFSVLTLGFIFKFLLCSKLQDPSQFEYSAVMSPVFILLQLIIIRACHLNQ